MSRALIQSRRADTCTYQPFHSSAFFHQTASGIFSFCTVKKNIFTDTFGYRRSFIHPLVTTATLAFCNDTATVSQCKVYQGRSL